jgi:hypothetical protein
MREGMEKLLVPSSEQVTVTRSQDPAAPGLIVTIQPGKDEYPGVTLKPAAPWDLSAFGHIEARVTNLGTKQLPLTLRVDDTGPWQDNPWNSNNAYIEPGKTSTATTIFGYTWGKPGYALKPQAVAQVLLFSGKSDVVQRFRIESLLAAGPAGEKPVVAPPKPEDKRIKPAGGVLFGAGAKVDAAQFISNNTKTEINGGAVRIVLPANQDKQFTTFRPAEGRWDLREALQVLVTVRNDGALPITPRARVESNGGPSEWATVTSPLAAGALAPGAQGEIAISFISSGIKDLEKKETLGRFTNDAVSAITIAADKADGERVLSVLSVRAGMPPAPVLPDWLGKRPPVAGDWVQTLNDDFNGDKLDTSVWSVAAPTTGTRPPTSAATTCSSAAAW